MALQKIPDQMLFNPRGEINMKKPLIKSICATVLLLLTNFLAREISTFHTPIIVFSLAVGIIVYAIYDARNG